MENNQYKAVNTFSALNKLLSKLPFSVLGYLNHEKEIDNFFLEVSASVFVATRDNIKFLSYSYADLDEPNSWEVRSSRGSFFFHSLNEKYSLLALNVYYTLRNDLFEHSKRKEKPKHLTNNVAIALSRLFLKEIGFRLSYTDEDNWHFGFHEQDSLFSIQVPLKKITKEGTKKGFSTALGTFLSEAIKAISSDEAQLKRLILQREMGSKSVYVKVAVAQQESPINAAYTKFLGAFRSKEELTELKNEMVSAICFWSRCNPGYISSKDTSENIENWVELFFPIAFISLAYDAWVEYIPAVCGVKEESHSENEFRNLGGMILGYQLGEEITKEERSIFRIISSRISATVAGQWLKDHNFEQKVKECRIEFKEFCEVLDKGKVPTKAPGKELNKSTYSDYLHGTAVNHEAHEILKGLIIPYSAAIGVDFSRWITNRDNKFSKYLTILCDRQWKEVLMTKYSWENSEHPNPECDSHDKKCIYCHILEVIPQSKNPFGYYINLPLLSELIVRFEEKEASPKTVLIEKDSSILIRYAHSFSAKQFYRRLSEGGGNFLKYVDDNTYTILAMCNFSICMDSSTGAEPILIFDLEKWARASKRWVEEQNLSDNTSNGFFLRFELVNSKL